MADERARERTAEEKMPEKIKALFDVAQQGGFAAVKREPNGSWRFIATKGDNEVWLTVSQDGNKVDGLKAVDLKSKQIISEVATVKKWVDLLAEAGVNAKEGIGSYAKIEPVRTKFYMEQPKLKGIGMTFGEDKKGGGLYPTSVGLIDVA
ncbi:MAG: hypothetical protein AAB548_03000 [Patescibacteria group bacterium]